MKNQLCLSWRRIVARILALLSVVGMTTPDVSSQPTLVSISVSPSHQTNSIGQQRQFTATGTFSDSSSRALTGGAGTWTAGAFCPLRSYGLGAAFVGGKLYAISGFFTTNLACYDPGTDQWELKASLPEFRQFFGTAVADGKIYVVGGDAGDFVNLRNTLLIYSATNNTWSSGAPMPQGPRFTLGAAAIDGKIYAVGGYGANYLATLEVYDPATDTWTTKAPMQNARFNPGVCVINGLLYVAGGGDSTGLLSSMEIYDPGTDTWTAGTPMPTARGGAAASLDGKFYFAGNGPPPKNTVDVFDPILNAWHSETPLTVGRDDLGVAADELGRKLYAVGGYTSSTYFTNLDVLTPPEVTWRSSAPAVATINANGVASAIEEGSTIISASSGGVSGSTTLVVVPGPPCVLQFGASAFSVSEGSASALFRVTRSGNTAGDATVHFSTGPGTAISGTDYEETSGMLTLADGETNATFSFPVFDNAVTDGNKTVLLGLSSPVGRALLGSPTNAVMTILDNEIVPGAGRLQFSGATYTVTEAGPVANVIITRTSGTVGAVAVSFATADGTATSGADYTAIVSNVTFAAGVASRTISIPILNDTLDETNETVLLTLSNPTGGASLGTPNATLSITDNDVAGKVSFSAAAYSLNETGLVARVVVSRTGGAASGVSVEFTARDGSATAPDYGPTNVVLTFAANELNKTNLISITDDLDPEGNETVNLTLRNPSGGAMLGAISNSVLTILDDEVSLQFSKAAYTNSEAGPLATITVSRSGPANKAVSVNFATSDDTAAVGNDYLGTNGILVLPAGTLSKSFGVKIVNDTLVESDETVFLQLSSPSNALLGPLTNATLLITNNDFGGEISFSATNFTVTEAGPLAMVMVKRVRGTASGVSVDFTTTDQTATAGADYTGVASNLTFKAGELTKTIKVPVLNDTLDDDNEKFRVLLSNATGGASVGVVSNGTVSITDNDVAGTVQFSLAGYSVSETGLTARVVVTRAGGAASGVSVELATTNGTAISGDDYESLNSVLTFAANELSKTNLISITNDSLPEGNERVDLTLRNPAGGAKLGAISNAVLTILDDESSVSFTNAAYAVSEAGPTVTVQAVRSGFSGASASVNYATIPGTALAGSDYITTNGTLTFGPGVTSRPITIKIINDTIVDTNESFELALSNPTGSLQLGSVSNAVVFITDNDSAGVVQFAAAVYSVTEGTASAAITVKRAGGLASGVTVQLATSDGTAEAGLDYQPVSTNLTFNAGELSKVVSVLILTDAIVETNETVNLTLSNPVGGASLGATNTATLTIVNKP